MYVDLCYERGYIVKLKGSTNGYGKLVDYATREYDDMCWPAGSVLNRICIYITFKGGG